jgi:sugar-specific transcriptional regulator TrmB
LKESELVDYLSTLDHIQKDDAKIFLYLSRNGQQKISTIAQDCGISRSRAYESLTRLIEMGYVFKEITEKQPRYDSISTNLLVERLIFENKKRKANIEKLDKIFKELMLNDKKDRNIHYSDNSESWKLDLDVFIRDAKKYIKAFFVVDDAINPYFMKNIFPSKSLLEKSKEFKDIKIMVNKSGSVPSILQPLIDNGIKIIYWKFTKNIPVFFLSVDGKYLSINSYSTRDMEFNFINSLTFENEIEYIKFYDYIFDFMALNNANSEKFSDTLEIKSINQEASINE